MLFRIVVVLLLVGAGIGAYLWFQDSIQLPFSMSGLSELHSSASLPQQLPSVHLPENASVQVSELSSRAKTVVDQAGTVLGTAIQESSDSGSIQERAFQYARYLYCQQVVKEYEATHQ